MQGIEIPIGAPLGQLDKDLKNAQGKLNSFASQASKSADALGSSVAKGSNQASFALTNLSRVAQDAPFGFIGIQNNIQPLLESFQRLKTESGSTGGAIKALGQSLIGGGGLLLAVSLVTSALTLLAQNPEKAAGALNYLAGVVDNATESQKAYNKELIETEANARTEISALESLIAIAQNEKLSRDARVQALQKIKAEYPEQLDFLTLENIKSQQAAKAIDLLSQSLLRKAKIQAAEKLLGEAFVKQLEATTKSAVQQASTFSKLVGAALGAVGIKNFVVLQNGIENQAKAFKEAGSEINIYNNLLKELRTQEAETGNLFVDRAKITKSVENIKRDNTKIKEVGKSVGVTISEGISEGFATTLPVVSVDLTNNLKSGLTDWQTYVNESLLPQVQNNFQTFFNDILMRGKLSFESLGKAILNTFLSILASDAARQVTGLLKFNTGAQYTESKKGGVGVIAGIAGLFKKGGVAASSGGVGTAASGGALLPILAGVAAVAGIASLLKKKPQAPLPVASSTISTSAAGSAQDFGGGRVVFEISGTNLVGVLNRAGAKLQRFGP